MTAESPGNHKRLTTLLILSYSFVDEKVHTDSGVALQNRKCKLFIAEHKKDTVAMTSHIWVTTSSSFLLSAYALAIQIM